MGEDDETTYVITSTTVDLYREADPEEAVCIRAALLLKNHLGKVGLDRPIVMGIETEYATYDTTVQKAHIRFETPVSS